MQEIVKNIFQIDDLRIINLSEHDDVLRKIMTAYLKEIEMISKMDDKQLEDSLADSSELTDKNKSEFNFYLSNLLYIKQSYFIDKKEQEETNKIDLEILKSLRLEELTNVEDFDNGTNIEIKFDIIREVIRNKTEENEKWSEYNVVSTISNSIGLPESSIKFISNLSEYIDFVSELTVNFVSRGQKDCTFNLLPSLHRRYKKDYEIHSDIYEGAFKQKIIYYDKEIKHKSDEELRAEGQHFGLPTDYLDFTEAHLISLLFAIEDYNYSTQHSIVYFIDSLAYNTDTVGQREKLIDYSIPSVIENMKRYASRSYFIKLGNSNERIHFQKGCFLKVSAQDKEEFGKKLYDHCKVVIINKEYKKEILKELFNLGITFENIYPDKDNVVKSIRFHYEELQGGNK
ncbi:FRG domain-containing protein [Marinicrinis sediminis]|uniref:FRG domain-containing protein n=1 Tax=Marinicrinis sediminis TaxID=1652465 RepID=A0ABW5RBJ6_9BACL